MRDPDLLIEMLRRMASDESGYIMVRVVMGRSQKERHHADLLVDAGHAQWISESAVRITASGYDFLNALDKQPTAEGKFLAWLEKVHHMPMQLSRRWSSCRRSWAAAEPSLLQT